MKTIVITRRALESIWLQSKGCPTETGGLLIGTTKRLTILEAGDPGPRSKKGPAMFTSDPEHDKAVLQLMRKKYGRQLDQLGHWHKQPSGMIRPSGEGGDLTQAKKLLDIMKHAGVADPFEVCVIAQDTSESDKCIYPYILEPGMSEFSELKLEIVTNSDPNIELLLKGEAIYLSSENEKHLWNDSNFGFQKTPVGKNRLVGEKQRLQKEGWEVTLLQDTTKNRVIMQLSREGEKNYIQFPPEYPLNPPLLLDADGKQEILDSSKAFYWNSDSSVVAWLERINLPETTSTKNKIKVVQGSSPARLRRVLISAVFAALIFYAGYLTALFLGHTTR